VILSLTGNSLFSAWTQSSLSLSLSCFRINSCLSLVVVVRNTYECRTYGGSVVTQYYLHTDVLLTQTHTRRKYKREKVVVKDRRIQSTLSHSLSQLFSFTHSTRRDVLSDHSFRKREISRSSFPTNKINNESSIRIKIVSLRKPTHTHITDADFSLMLLWDYPNA